MPVFTVYALGESNISVSGDAQLSGVSQGNGSHLVGETLTLTDNAWEAVDVFDSEADFQDSDNSQTLNATQFFNGTEYTGGLRVEAEYELTLQDPDGVTYIVLGFNINEPGVTSYATVEGLAFVGGVGGFPPIGVPLTVVSSSEGPSRPFSTLASPPCFITGTQVSTTDGLIPVEDLQPGHIIQTLDGGLRPLVWVGRVHVPKVVQKHDIRFRPVLVKENAFGPGSPSRDMRLSQQHRVLMRGWRAELFCGETEVLVPICKLINDTTIRLCPPDEDVTYVHLLFDRHEVIWADNLLSESYLLDLNDTSATSQEVLRLFPEMAQMKQKMRSARLCVPGRLARVLH
ncbi:MAG: Hint domain-containing protein [Pseudomonadota bacterium]